MFVQPPSGRFDGSTHLFPVRVHYEDTDLSGITYHANYLRWFERARSDMLRLLGVDQRLAAQDGTGTYAVAELSIRYRAPARLDDVVAIVTRARQVGAASVTLAQEAWLQQSAIQVAEPMADADRRGTMLADATVRVGFVGPDGRPRRQPAAWRAAFQTVPGPVVAAEETR